MRTPKTILVFFAAIAWMAAIDVYSDPSPGDSTSPFAAWGKTLYSLAIFAVFCLLALLIDIGLGSLGRRQLIAAQRSQSESTNFNPGDGDETPTPAPSMRWLIQRRRSSFLLLLCLVLGAASVLDLFAFGARFSIVAVLVGITPLLGLIWWLYHVGQTGLGGGFLVGFIVMFDASGAATGFDPYHAHTSLAAAVVAVPFIGGLSSEPLALLTLSLPLWLLVIALALRVWLLALGASLLAGAVFSIMHLGPVAAAVLPLSIFLIFSTWTGPGGLLGWLVGVLGIVLTLVGYVFVNRFLHDAPRSPSRLLVLRRFRSRGRVDALLSKLIGLWSYAGPIELIHGPDTVVSLQRPIDVFEVLTWSLGRRLIRTEDQIRAAIKSPIAPLRDGTFDVKNYICSDGTWKTTVESLMCRASAILLDASGLEPGKKEETGLDIEIELLKRTDASKRAVVLVRSQDQFNEIVERGIPAERIVAMESGPDWKIMTWALRLVTFP